MHERPQLRILIADDHPVVREGLAAFINRRPDMTVVAEASNGREAVELYCRHRPDVSLVDLRMPQMDGLDVIIAIRRENSEARMIILTTFDHEEDIFRSLRAGAKAYLLKDAPCDELLACLRAVHQGKTIISSGIAAKLAGHMSPST